MHSASAWGSAELSLRQPVQQAPTYPGFADEETALFCLTHPLVGFYHRLRDRRLGAYRVWHDRLAVQPAELLSARFALFDRLGLVNYARQQFPHSVLVQPINDFTVYLPPTRLE